MIYGSHSRLTIHHSRNVTMRLYGLIGKPLAQSFSKKYFTAKFAAEGITGCRYELFPLESIEALPALLQSQPELCGLNVTIPYKQQVISYVDDATHLPLPACNCIRITDGKLTGYNTDVTGFEISFLKEKGPYHNRALVLGTGGSSLAVQYVLQKLAIPFGVVSRSAGATFTYAALDAAVMASHNIIINTTPLGSFPAVDNCPDLPYQFITPQHYCYDLVYNPAVTLFLQKAAAQGATIKNGHDMLEIQAEESWKIWNR
jgi:shikimate dehydrogenase